MDRFKIHDCCFEKQKKANKNNVKSCTKYSIYKERKAIEKKHLIHGELKKAQLMMSFFYLGKKIIPKPYLKSTR
jgi:hypothetical protein